MDHAAPLNKLIAQVLHEPSMHLPAGGGGSVVRDFRIVNATIRVYREADRPAVVRLSLLAWAPVHGSIREVLGDEIFEGLYGDDWRRQQQHDVEKVLSDGKSEVRVAEVDGDVVGFVAAGMEADSTMGEISMVAVDPVFQNRGLGTQLTDSATDWLREAGTSVVLVSTGGDVGHAPARRTYEKAGFTPMPIVNYFKAL
jgi:ribosomal protein S18 acetylase RimI-like enzyme